MTKTYNFPLDIKKVGSDGTFSGYGSVFNNKDFWDDIVLPGAFTKSLAQKMPVMLWQHNSDEPIGIWTALTEDEKGLYVEGKLLINDVTRAKEAHALLTAKAISGLSIGYRATSWEWQKDAATNDSVRLLKEVDLWEISLVTFPANESARVGDVKSLKTIRDIEELLRDAGGLSRNEVKGLISKMREVLRDADAGDEEKKKAEEVKQALINLKNTIGGI